MSGRLVGRRQELAALVAALDGLQRVGASCAQVTGEPGIGKTRLLAELCEIAAARGAVVLVGRGAELERDAPFGIVIDALDDHLRALPAPSLRRLCEPQLGELQPLLPALAGLGSAPARRSEDERYRTYRAIRALVERLAAERPLLLAFDDLHWADAASLELVSFLLRRPPRARVLVVLSWCPGRAPGLTEAVSARARDLPGVTIGLGGLDQTEVGALVGAAFDRRQLERLHRASGGNPFYAQALAGDVCRSGTRSLPADDEPDAVPDSVRSAVAHEIGSLSAPARLLAQGAAVAGEPFELELAARCAGISALAAQPAIDELVLAAIVHPVQGLRRFAFRHPIVRRAVYDSAGPGWGARAHARAAALLSQRGAPATAAAHHVARSAAPGDMAAAELLLAAAGEVLTRAPASAAAWLEAAAAIVPEQAETAGIRLALLTAQARVRGLLGELQPAAEALSRAQELIPAGDPLRVELIAGIAGIEHESAGPGEEAVSDGTACRLLEARVQAELRRGHSAAGAELCARAEALAAALGTPASAGFAARAQAQMLASPDPRAALVLAEAALAFDAAGDLWVANRIGNTVVEYARSQLDGSGDPTPAVTLGAGSSGTLNAPDALAFDAAGDLWVGDQDEPAGPGGDTQGLILEYARSQLSASGDPSPRVTLAAPGSGLCDGFVCFWPAAFAFDPAGDLWVADAGVQGTNPSVLEYTPGQLAVGGDPVAAVTIGSDGADSLSTPDGVSFDAAGDLWVDNQGGPSGSAGANGSVVEFTPGQLGASGAPTPADTIAGATSGLDGPWGLVIEQAPTVAGISPASGPAKGGTTVTIQGTGFYPGSTVDFGATAAVSVTYVSAYELKAVAPAGSGTVDVTVTTGEGTSVTSAADRFTMVPVPRLISAPRITGRAKAGSGLSCSTGAWSGSPTTFSYRWSRDGTPIHGATGSRYRVRSADEQLTVRCAVTAANADGSGAAATSRGVKVPVPKVRGCPAASGSLGATRLGLARLGMTREAVRHAYRRSRDRRAAHQDRFCLTPIGVRAGYPAPGLLRTLARGLRRRLSGRVAWVTTASGFYAVHGVSVGATLAAARARLRLTGPFRVRGASWYLAANGSGVAMLEVSGGLVAEVGIADKRLTRSRKADRALLSTVS